MTVEVEAKEQPVLKLKTDLEQPGRTQNVRNQA